MPTVISSKIKTEDSERVVRIKFYPKVHYLRLLVFALFLFLAFIKESWFMGAFAVVLIFITFKGKMVEIQKYNKDTVCVFHFLFFLKFKDYCFLDKSSIKVAVSRFKPIG
ncbi:MAG: hypothetical protein KDD29_10550, partial [Flavobacteriales bacterium]|nr:hypothetical protein [Flavobacteriales bacterium]